MPAYLVHQSAERARFRHPVFSSDAAKLQAMEVLKKAKGIAGIKPGSSSLLVFLEPGADVAAMCASLEAALPELAAAPAQGRRPAPSRAVAHRKFMVKNLLGWGLTTVTLAAVGLHHVHALVGAGFACFAANHVWERRRGL